MTPPVVSSARATRKSKSFGNHSVLCSSLCLKSPAGGIKIWGFPADLDSGLQAIMKVRFDVLNYAAHHPPIFLYYIVPLNIFMSIYLGSISLSRQSLTYISKTSFTKSIAKEHPGVTVYLSSYVPLDNGEHMLLD